MTAIPDPPLEPREPKPNYPACPVCGYEEPEYFYFHDGLCFGCDHCVETKDYFEVEGFD